MITCSCLLALKRKYKTAPGRFVAQLFGLWLTVIRDFKLTASLSATLILFSPIFLQLCILQCVKNVAEFCLQQHPGGLPQQNSVLSL